MVTLLTDNPLILLFLVAAIGYFFGNISIKGSKLGVSAVLFVGLAFGAYHSEFNVPDIIFQIGLVFFVYSIGLASGPAFFKSFRKSGSNDLLFVLLMLLLSALVALGVKYLFEFDAATTVGLYSGSTTNTPALAGVIDLVSQGNSTDKSTIIQRLAIGYTYSYPIGVIGVMLAIVIMERLFKVDYRKEEGQLRHKYNVQEELTSKSVVVTNQEVVGKQLRDIRTESDFIVNFGRMVSDDGTYSLPNWDTKFVLGDRLLLIGSAVDLDQAISYFGEETDDKLTLSRKEFDTRRIFVSNPQIVGKTLSELNIDEKFNAIITRIRRGDTDMLANGNTILEQGDRVRFVARRKDLKRLADFFGDSYYGSSSVNIFSFGFGIALGLLIGTIEFSLPGGINLKLGYAGGPLLVSLILGALHRTGKTVWTLPYSANVTLRQIGLTLFLAVIGLQSGNTFVESLTSSGGGLLIFTGGVIITVLSACLSLFVGYKLFKCPYSLLLGFMSNQPAILDFALNRSQNKIPMVGYSIMFPIALIMKIVYAQLMYLLLV